jgi:hypothetical protein
MTFEYLHALYLRFLGWLNAFTSAGNWKFKITFLALALSLFFAFPSYQTYLSGKLNEKWEAVSEQIKAPLATHDNYSNDSHFSKLAFRLTVPMIAHVLHVDRVGCFLIQGVFFVLMFYVLLSLAYAVTNDKVLASLILLGFAFMFVGNVLVSDLRAVFDGVAFCFMALTMLNRNFFLVLIFSLLAYFTDERALVASGLILIWFVIREKQLDTFSLKDFFRLNAASLALVCSWVVYFIGRYLLGHIFGLKTSTGGTNMLSHQLNNILFGAWTGLEGFWVLVLLGFLALWIRRFYVLGFAIVLAMLVVMYIAYSVIDITRSFAYIFPVIFIFLHILSRMENPARLRQYVFLSFLICLVPTYYTDGEGSILYYFPLPFRIAGLFMHQPG